MTASWSILSLTELLTTLGDPEQDFDLSGAVARIAETLDAEVAAAIVGDEIEYAIGFGRQATPQALIIQLARSGVREGMLPGIGEVAISSTEIEQVDGWLFVARTGDAFTADEVGFVRALGRVVGMAMSMRRALGAERAVGQDLQRRVDDNRRLVGQLRERQGLLDRLFRIQKSISHRLPTQEVLDAICEGAADLLGVAQASIRLIDPANPDALVLVAHRGVSENEASRYAEVKVGERIPEEVIRQGRLAVRYGLESAEAPVSLMSAAVEVGGDVVGCLSVGDPRNHRFSPPEQEALLALAQHASLALQDARATDAMRSALDRERHRAEHDGLTGLPNRSAVRLALAESISRVHEVPVSVLFVDLDRFKLANDTLGHAFGDHVLRVVADRLRTAVRDRDIVGRLSGDEFVVICEGIGDAGAIEFAERLRRTIEEPIQHGEVNHVLTASVGISEANVDDRAEQVLANADLAMYRAKQAGRSRTEVFDREMRLDVEERLRVGQELQRAIREREFRVFLQPVVELPARRVAGFEALVRWDHPERGVLLPISFVPLAEDVGLVGEIDRLVLSAVIGLLRDHPDARPIAANLSARTFADRGLVDWLSERLVETGVSAERLIIEVTETVLMDGDGDVSQLAALRDLGAKVMIDDFGTGYSSLAYLQEFDIDGVKIDRSFIARLGVDRRAEAIIAAVFNMAEALGFIVVAEGIETDEQVAHMAAIRDRCGEVEVHAQGFLFGRPTDGRQRLAGFIEVPAVQRVG